MAGGLLLAVALGASEVAHAEPGPPSAGSIAAEVFREAGIEVHARGLGEAVERATERAVGSLDPATARVLRARVAERVSAEALVEAARAAFARAGMREPAERTRDFYRTPVGRRLRALEARTESGIDDETISAFVDTLFAEPVDLERVRILDRIARATRGAELAAEVDAIAARSIARVVHGDTGRDADSAALEAALAAIERDRAAAASMWRAQSSVLMQLVYRDATDDELRAYAAFAESPDGRWLVEATARMLADLDDWLTRRLATPVAAPAPPGP